MTVLVTGASGLVGRAVAEALHAQGRKVLGIDARGPDAEAGAPRAQADLLDTHRLYALLHAHEVRSIVHAGGVSGPMVARDNPAMIAAVNVMGTVHLLEAARTHGLGRFVFLSSGQAYGAAPTTPLREDTPLRATDVYGASKVAGEALVGAYEASHKVDAVILRLGSVYGPRRRTACALRTMIVDALRHRPTRLPWGRGYRRHYVHVDDAVAGVLAALDARAPPQRAYNISGAEYPTMDEVAEMVRRLLPKADIALEAGPDPLGYVRGPLDGMAAQRDLKFVPRVTLRDGIARYVDWLRAHPDG